MPTIQVRVAASGDDGEWVPAFSLTADGAAANVKNSFGVNHAFARFAGAAIAALKGATIQSAVASFRATLTNATALGTTFGFEEADDAAAPTTAADADARSLAAPQSWDVPAFTSGEDYSSPELAESLQAVVDRAGFDDAVLLLWKQASGTGTRQFRTFDGDEENAPLLTVSYTPASDSAPRLRRLLRP